MSDLTKQATGTNGSVKFNQTSEFPSEVAVAFISFLNDCRGTAETYLALSLKNQELKMRARELELKAEFNNPIRSNTKP